MPSAEPVEACLPLAAQTRPTSKAQLFGQRQKSTMEDRSNYRHLNKDKIATFLFETNFYHDYPRESTFKYHASASHNLHKPRTQNLPYFSRAA